MPPSAFFLLSILDNLLHDPIGIATIVLLMCLAPYWAIPLVIYGTQSFSSDPTFDEFDPETTPPPKSVRKFFRQVQPQLEALGFELIHHVSISDAVPNVVMMLQLYRSQLEDDLAMSVCAFGMADGQAGRAVNLQEQYVEFSSELRDGTEINTNNTQQEPPFAKVPVKVNYLFMGMEDLDLLYTIHKTAIQMHGGKRKPIPHDIVEEVRQGMINEFEQQIETGYLREGVGVFRPTVKGACMMTWKQLWPIKHIRRARRRSQNERLLADWGIDNSGIELL